MAATKRDFIDRLYCEDCLSWMRKMPSDYVDLTMGSPPYVFKGHRYIGGKKVKWTVEAWIEWMLPIVHEAVRITSGYVVFVANGAVIKGAYQPACEGPIYEAYRQGIVCERPAIWSKNAPPNRKGEWFKNTWEFCMSFKTVGTKPYFDWEAIAEPPKYKTGGRFRQRKSNGERRLGNEYPTNKLAQPGDVIRATVGGGQMGHPLAHKNEAPYPESLVEPFVKTCCPEGGIVFDPFCGSGTTAAVAMKLGRHYVATDVRASQIELATRRLKDVQEKRSTEV